MEDNGSGRPLEAIYRNAANPFEFDNIEDIRPCEKHTVLFEFPYKESDIPKPFQGRKVNYVDKDHVLLPCSPAAVIPTEHVGGGTVPESLWSRIQLSLLREFSSSWELENAIRSYNNKIGTFDSLHNFFSTNGVASTYFFTVLLPKIVRLALQLPDLIKTGIPLLKQSRNHSISLSQLQIASLLANAFLCTFPRKKYQDQYNYPDINFNRLFESCGPQVEGKIECIINYFRRVCIKTPMGVLTFTRRSIRTQNLPNWSKIKEKLSNTPLHLTSEGTIEDQGIGLLQVDFANKYIGGGVLGGGCVQEEIRFVICPELIVSRLFTEFLKDNEALVMAGAEQFNTYVGYAHTFKFGKDIKDSTPIDSKNRRRQTYIVAIDAHHFSNPTRQYEDRFIKRELNKAFVGFSHTLDTPAPGVATGNWGCGAFGGDPQLKALIQLMACTITNRPLLYFTFGDRNLKNDIYQMYIFLVENDINIQQLLQLLHEYKDERNIREDLYEFIKRRHSEQKNSLFNFVSNLFKDIIINILPALSNCLGGTFFACGFSVLLLLILIGYDDSRVQRNIENQDIDDSPLHENDEDLQLSMLYNKSLETL